MHDNHYTKEQQNDFFVPQKSSFLTLFLKFWAAAFCVEQVSLPRNGSEQNSELFSLPRKDSEGNSESMLLFLFPRNGIPSFFSLPLKCSEGNSESLLLFLFNGTEFRVVFSSVEGFGMEFRGFLFRGTAGILSEITLCSVYSVFHGIIFLSEIPNPNCCWVTCFCWRS